MRISDWSSDVCSSDLEHEEDALKKRSSALPETQQEVLSLMRDLEVNTQIYTTLLNSTQELQVTKAGTVGNVRIIDYPLVPDKRAKPKAVLVLAISVARSEMDTSELQSPMRNSYAVFCLNKKKQTTTT